jgi:Lectin C-type domain
MKAITKLIAAGILAAAGLQTASAAPIFNPATSHWYDFVSGGAAGDWAVAEANSVALGGHLVTINDAAEQAWLLSNFGAQDLLWIGFTDAASEGTFVWTSGEAVTYTNWSGGEPNDFASGEDHTVMNWGGGGGWNDYCPGPSTSCGVARGIAEWTRTAVPEPGMLALTLSSIGVMGLVSRRRRGIGQR